METLTNTNINSNITYVTAFRLFLHTNIYTSEILLNQLVTSLSNSLSIINYELDMENKVIKLKIRKSIYKKKSTFNHDVLYYYPIISSAFLEFIKSISCYIDPATTDVVNDILNNNISLLYNIVCIGDNMIIIQL